MSFKVNGQNISNGHVLIHGDSISHPSMIRPYTIGQRGRIPGPISEAYANGTLSVLEVKAKRIGAVPVVRATTRDLFLEVAALEQPKRIPALSKIIQRIHEADKPPKSSRQFKDSATEEMVLRIIREHNIPILNKKEYTNKEWNIFRDVLDSNEYLQCLSNICFVIPQPYGTQAVPDLFICYYGHIIKLEVKAAKKKPMLNSSVPNPKHIYIIKLDDGKNFCFFGKSFIDACGGDEFLDDIAKYKEESSAVADKYNAKFSDGRYKNKAGANVYPRFMLDFYNMNILEEINEPDTIISFLENLNVESVAGNVIVP